MISRKLQDAFNAQINAELWSAYLYLSMSLDAETKALKGVANWFWVQWLEEQDHARIFQNYLMAQDAKVELMPIAPVENEWNSVLEMFKDTLKHEIEVTEMIHRLAVIARDQSDFAALARLQWFVDEQVEEEQSARDMIALLEMAQGSPAAIFALDRQLADREYHRADAL